MRPHVGVDLDNTLVRYDEAFHRRAVAAGLIEASCPADKSAIRQAIRDSGPQGNDLWTRLQGEVYGTMDGARLAPGAAGFLAACRAAGVRVSIVSHKTRFPASGPGPDLREAARAWLAAAELVRDGPAGIDLVDLHFADTRADKAAAIGAIGCTHFVDDLPEVFAEPGFPAQTIPILYEPRTGWDPIGRRILVLDPLVASLGDRVAAVEEMKGGGNNRMARLEGTSGRRYVAKSYFRSDRDRRDRLGAEFAALRFLRDAGVECVPEPLARDDAGGVGLYSFVEGEPVGEVTGDDVAAAAAFVLRLKELAALDRAGSLPEASEACFDVESYLRGVSARLAALQRIRTNGALTRAVHAFATERLPACLELALQAAMMRGRRGGLEGAIPLAERTLSPSDFGFHNALRRANGSLVFLDFEYFGWDDPAKLIADFLLHPAGGLPAAHRRAFLTAVIGPLGGRRLLERLRMVYPLAGVKWCLILLNEFVPGSLARRAFARPGLDVDEARQAQLEKAQSLLARIVRELPAIEDVIA